MDLAHGEEVTPPTPRSPLCAACGRLGKHGQRRQQIHQEQQAEPLLPRGPSGSHFLSLWAGSWLVGQGGVDQAPCGPIGRSRTQVCVFLHGPRTAPLEAPGGSGVPVWNQEVSVDTAAFCQHGAAEIQFLFPENQTHPAYVLSHTDLHRVVAHFVSRTRLAVNLLADL